MTTVIDRLTDAELEVLVEAASGDPHYVIARRRGVRANTVKNQLHAAYGKLGVRGLVEAYLVLGWLRVPQNLT